MSRIVKWGAISEEGCEFLATTKKEIIQFIKDEMAGEGHSGERVSEDHYYIYGYTKEELAKMVEV